MKALEDKILKEGKVLPGNILKVGSFLNHQLDPALLADMGKEIARLYAESGATRILTIEASGIAIALAAGMAMHLPVVFAKKGRTINISKDTYCVKVYSYTHQQEYPVMVSKEFLHAGDRVLIIDDFLANGKALNGLIDLVHLAGAEVVGCAVAIEKAFQNGGNELRATGLRVESLAMIESMTDTGLTFVNQD